MGERIQAHHFRREEVGEGGRDKRWTTWELIRQDDAASAAAAAAAADVRRRSSIL